MNLGVLLAVLIVAALVLAWIFWPAPADDWDDSPRDEFTRTDSDRF